MTGFVLCYQSFETVSLLVISPGDMGQKTPTTSEGLLSSIHIKLEQMKTPDPVQGLTACAYKNITQTMVQDHLINLIYTYKLFQNLKESLRPILKAQRVCVS